MGLDVLDEFFDKLYYKYIMVPCMVHNILDVSYRLDLFVPQYSHTNIQYIFPYLLVIIFYLQNMLVTQLMPRTLPLPDSLIPCIDTYKKTFDKTIHHTTNHLIEKKTIGIVVTSSKKSMYRYLHIVELYEFKIPKQGDKWGIRSDIFFV
jgi:hypothetical protein